MKQLLLCSLILVLDFFVPVKAQELSYEPEDPIIYGKYLADMHQKKPATWEELLTQTALFFLNTPYTAATLEKEPEVLVVNLREMDCTTFVENVLALARTYKAEDQSFEAFTRNLCKLRYRKGETVSYTSRLHYITDWMYDNQKSGVVEDITLGAGGEPFFPELSFMSTHPDSYPQLKKDPSLVRKIGDIEKQINSRAYFYVPTEQISERYGFMKSGDVVFFTTSIKGLDGTHMGVIYRKDGVVTFIHASSAAKKVIIDKSSLQDYAEGIKTTSGIILARPLPVD